jgi:eukaryotic-like serine/threonine-protein kinase
MSDQPPASEPSTGTATPVKELTGHVGKYEIITVLGKGAMGQVYLARDTRLDREVALKVMMGNIADDPELKARFEREAKAVARMKHANVVMVYDFDYHTDGSPYIAMERLTGKDLQKAVRTPPPMSVERKVAIIVQVLGGLAHAHKAGIVHRDIKPANIFINDDGSVKIMDFGVARLTAGSMTGTGNIVGTADYMSPEQVKGSRVDGRSDVFSVGCMLYELLAGRRPFHSDNLMAIFYKITHEEANFDLIPQGEEYDALLPILKRAMSKNLEERYQTAYDFAMDLRTWLQVHASSATVQNALEALVGLEAPTHPPSPMDSGSFLPVDGPEPQGTVDLGTGRRTRSSSLSGRPTSRPPARSTLSGTRGPGATLVDGTGVGATQKPGTTRLGAAAPPTVLRPGRPEPRPAPPGRNPALFAGLGLLLVAGLGFGGYFYWQRQQPPPVPPETVALAPPPTTAPPPITLEATPPPTAAPPPTFAEARGKSAAAIKAAQAAFRSGSYDKAIASAQQALQEDPGNEDAEKVVENALNGQRAHRRLLAADAALQQRDFATAESETNAARGLAPWDSQVTNMLSRIRDAQLQAQREAEQKTAALAAAAAQQTATQIAGLLDRADGALANRQYDGAIKLYDDALRLDPSNATARAGRTGAIAARTTAEAAASGGGATKAGKAFVAGRTQATSTESKGGSVPEGFEESAGVAVKKGTQAAELPGKINFDVSPDPVKPGERFTANIAVLNEGLAPIQIQSVVVTTTVNGKRSGGVPVPPLAKDVAPRQKTVVLSLSDIWKENTSSWTMEVTVRTIRGETYKNSVKWE